MDTQGLIIFPGQGPVWEMETGRPTTFKLLSDQTQGSIAIFEEIVPVGSGTPLHIHPESDEVIHILSGAFTFKIGAQVMKADADTWVFIPRGTAHAWKNTGSEVGRAFYIFAPAESAKFFENCENLRSRLFRLIRRHSSSTVNAMATNWLICTHLGRFRSVFLV
jgi:quercetin dioxygenase-like cupin family protein